MTTQLFTTTTDDSNTWLIVQAQKTLVAWMESLFEAGLQPEQVADIVRLTIPMSQLAPPCPNRQCGKCTIAGIDLENF